MSGKASYEDLEKEIARLKKLEVELNKSKRLLSQAEEIVKIGSWEYNPETDQASWSDGLFQIFKRSPADGAPDFSEQSGFYSAESYEILKEAVEECVKNGTPYNVTVQAICSDGEIRTCISHGRAERNEEGITVRLWGTFEDITDQLRNEQALQISERKYSALFENLVDEVHVWQVIKDRTGKITGWILSDINRSGLRGWKKKKEEVIGKTANEIFGSDAHTQFMPVVEKIFSTGKHHSWVQYFEPTDQYLSMESIPFGDYFISTGKDISAMKKAEKVIKEREAMIRHILKHAPIGIAVFDRDMNYLFASDQFQEYYGVYNLIGKNHYDVFPNHPGHLVETHSKVLKGAVVSATDDFFTVNGKTNYQSWKCLPWYQSDGSIGGISIFVEITTTRKLAELKLQDSLIDLKLAQEIANVGNWQYDPQIGTPVWSETVFSIYERERESGPFQLEEYKEVYDQKQYDIFSKAFQRAVEDGIPYNIELKLSFPDGRVKWVQAICQPAETKGPAGYFLRGTIQDITEQKEQEIKIQKYSKELEEAIQTKDTFFGIIAHDLRNPFGAFMQGTELLNESVQSSENEFVRTLTGELYESARQLYALLENLLTWSRMQRGIVNFEPHGIDIQELLISVFENVSETARQKNIELISLIPQETFVIADKNMLEAVFRNLITNAIKFTKPGGKVRIEYGNSDDEIEIRVTDSGIGIPAAKLNKLFKTGERNKTTPGTNKEKGTGLGLILCKEFVEKHGGSIRAESEEGKGSTFIFTLPNR